MAQKMHANETGMLLIRRLAVPFLAALALIASASPAWAIAIAPPFDAVYTFTDMGSVPGVPARYGGLTLKADDPNTLLIGGNANAPPGALFSVGVVRGVDNHITGFAGPAQRFADAAFNDGGVVYGPNNVLFLARWPVNELGQTKFGSTMTDKIIALGPKGVVPSPGGLAFVPAGFPGAGQLKLVSWAGGQWYTLAISPDGLGTFNVDSATLETQIVGGPEGIFYVPPGSQLFADFDSVLVAEFSANGIAAYTLDANGDPEPASRQLFMTGLTGAEGAAIDPLTGDFLFSTFGGGDRVVVVKGFERPQQPPPLPEPATLLLLASGLAGMGALAWRRRGAK